MALRLFDPFSGHGRIPPRAAPSREGPPLSTLSSHWTPKLPARSARRRAVCDASPCRLRRLVSGDGRRLTLKEYPMLDAKPAHSSPAEAEALRRLQEFLGHPDFVDRAHQHLTALAREARLRRGEMAIDGLGAEIRWDLGPLLLAAGQPDFTARRFVGNMQRTAGSRAGPRGRPRAAGALPPGPAGCLATTKAEGGQASPAR